MPQSNRLFQEKMLSRALKGVDFPDDLAACHQKLLQWVQALESSTLDAVKNLLHRSNLRTTRPDVEDGSAENALQLSVGRTIYDKGKWWAMPTLLF